MNLITSKKYYRPQSFIRCFLCFFFWSSQYIFFNPVTKLMYLGCMSNTVYTVRS